jgi:superfamily II DNA/RNA helicase
VDLVVNMDLPYDAETYLHRIGRSGRYGVLQRCAWRPTPTLLLSLFKPMLLANAGAQGMAVSIVTQDELPQLQRIWAKYHTDAVEWAPPPANQSDAPLESADATANRSLPAEYVCLTARVVRWCSSR